MLLGGCGIHLLGAILMFYCEGQADGNPRELLRSYLYGIRGTSFFEF